MEQSSEEDTVELPEETVADLTRRLRRAEGQVRGVQQMLAERRDCRDIVTQLSAATKALEQAGGVKKHAAELMGISQRALSYYLAKYRLET